MQAGLCLLRLSPADFWAMTPIELRYAAGRLFAPADAPTRAVFDEMMRRFPDRGGNPHP